MSKSFIFCMPKEWSVEDLQEWIEKENFHEIRSLNQDVTITISEETKCDKCDKEGFSHKRISGSIMRTKASFPEREDFKIGV